MTKNPKIPDFISPKCTSDAERENIHNKSGDFVFELRQIISRHRWEDEYCTRIDNEEGMANEIFQLCKEQMMKEAVEGFIFQSESYYPKELIAHYEGDLQMGDKVRIIIVKEEKNGKE